MASTATYTACRPEPEWPARSKSFPELRPRRSTGGREPSAPGLFLLADVDLALSQRPPGPQRKAPEAPGDHADDRRGQQQHPPRGEEPVAEQTAARGIALPRRRLDLRGDEAGIGVLRRGPERDVVLPQAFLQQDRKSVV